MSPPVVAIALSGGIDSLIAAFLLKQRGYDVIGVHFTTGYETSCPDLTSIKDQLKIPIRMIDLSKPFKTHVVDYFVSAYEQGRTPNPCLICNQKIKFGALLTAAIKMGAQYLSTGHYAAVEQETLEQGGRYYLVKGRDDFKDQSYFLSMLTSDQISRLIFPLSDLTKDEVRQIARENHLTPVSTKESQDVCFIPQNMTAEFIETRLSDTPKKGPIRDMKGQIIGEHQGLHRFTIGQRRGINCPGPEPYYVKQIDTSSNTLVVCTKSEIKETSAAIALFNWNDTPFDHQGQKIRVETKIRYNHKASPSTLVWNDSSVKVLFDEPQFAVTPGQGAVFYRKNRVLGAGIIL